MKYTAETLTVKFFEIWQNGSGPIHTEVDSEWLSARMSFQLEYEFLDSCKP